MPSWMPQLVAGLALAGCVASPTAEHEREPDAAVVADAAPAGEATDATPFDAQRPRADAAEPADARPRPDLGAPAPDAAPPPDAGARELCNGRDDDDDPETLDGADEPWIGARCDGEDQDLCPERLLQCVGGQRICTDFSTEHPPELCDGQDNDCVPATADGVDEAWFGEPCDGDDEDGCPDGVMRCEAGQPTCTGDDGQRREICNGRDDDCDGLIDEDFVRARDGVPVDLDDQPVGDAVDRLVYVSDAHCGACERSCPPDGPNVAGGACTDEGTCGLVCADGFSDLDGQADTGCEVGDCVEATVGAEAMATRGSACRIETASDLSPACACAGTMTCRVGPAPAVVCGVVGPEGQVLTDPLSVAHCPRAARLNVQDELCDGLDNDCDGAVDESFVLLNVDGEPWLIDGEPTYSHPHHCGACDRPCELPNAVPRCDGVTCAVASCSPGWLDLDSEPENGCEYGCIPTGVEECDGEDNDCDGVADDGFHLPTDPYHCGACGRACEVPNGVAGCRDSECTVARCEAGWLDVDGDPDNGCEAECEASGPEICDGADNDCDGVVDRLWATDDAPWVATDGEWRAATGRLRAGSITAPAGHHAAFDLRASFVHHAGAVSLFANVAADAQVATPDFVAQRAGVGVELDLEAGRLAYACGDSHGQALPWDASALADGQWVELRLRRSDGGTLQLRAWPQRAPEPEVWHFTAEDCGDTAPERSHLGAGVQGGFDAAISLLEVELFCR
jgi:hypothetical protein